MYLQSRCNIHILENSLGFYVFGVALWQLVSRGMIYFRSEQNYSIARVLSYPFVPIQHGI